VKPRTAAEWLEEGLDNLALRASADTASQLQGDLRRALEAFEQALALAPDDVVVGRHRAETLVELEDWDDALDAFVSLAGHGVTGAWLHASVARCAFRLERFKQAVEAASAALALEPTDLDVAVLRAEALASLGDFAAAREAWVQLLSDERLSTHPARVQARIGFATAVESLAEDASDAWFALVSEEESRLYGPLAPRAFITALARHDALLSALQVWLDATDEDTGRLHRVGGALLRAQRAQAAIVVGRRLVQRETKGTEAAARAWFFLAEALAQAGSLDEAVDAYESALDAWPGFLGASARLEVIQTQRGRPPERWRVMGTDTFAREEYLVGVFDSKRAAQRALRAKEVASLRQDEALRDTYWIEPA
jgi:Flp pilus assembly protein TadD